MDNLLLFDQQLFLFLNHLPHNRLFDLSARILSGIGMGGMVWFILGIILFIREERKHHWFFAPILLAGGVSWVLVEKVIKITVARARPSLEMGAIVVGAVNRKNDFAFPSGHATIAFALAMVLSKIEPKWKWLFYILAISISFTRIYLGKHFPLDVLAGALIGWGIGNFSWRLVKYINNRFKIVS